MNDRMICVVQHGPQDRENGNKGRVNPAEVRAVRFAMSRRNKKMLQDNVSFYCTIELINASADVVEIGKNVKLEDGEPHESHGNDNKMVNTDSVLLELRRDGMDKRHVCEDIDTVVVK